MTQPLLYAFDLDDTLAPSKQPLPPPMADALADLLDYRPVLVISGGDVSQFRTQLLGELPVRANLDRLHLMPTCGTRYLRYDGQTFTHVYEHTLEPHLRDRAIAALENRARQLNLWEEDTWGEIIEDRGTQVTFSALGQRAPVDAKKAWDPSGEKKELLREAVAKDLPELDVHSGGSTSVDITRRGVDKAYGMTALAKRTGIALADMMFVGDRLDPGGNDRPVLELGVPCKAVADWQECVAVVRDFVADLQALTTR